MKSVNKFFKMNFKECSEFLMLTELAKEEWRTWWPPQESVNGFRSMHSIELIYNEHCSSNGSQWDFKQHESPTIRNLYEGMRSKAISWSLSRKRSESSRILWFLRGWVATRFLSSSGQPLLIGNRVSTSFLWKDDTLP